MSIRNIIKAGLAGDARMAETSGHNQDIINDAARYNKFMENQQKILQFGAQQKQGQELKAKLNELALSTGDPNRTDSYDPNLSGAYNLAASSINPLTGEMNKDYLEVAGFGAGISKAKAGADASMQRLLQGQQFQTRMQEDKQAYDAQKEEDKYVTSTQLNPKSKQEIAAAVMPELVQQASALANEYKTTKDPKRKASLYQQIQALDTQIQSLSSDPKVIRATYRGQAVPRESDGSIFGNDGQGLGVLQVPDFGKKLITPDPRLIQQQIPQQQPSGVWPY